MTDHSLDRITAEAATISRLTQERQAAEARRNASIRDANEAGIPQTEICAAAHLTREQIRRICRRT